MSAASQIKVLLSKLSSKELDEVILMAKVYKSKMKETPSEYRYNLFYEILTNQLRAAIPFRPAPLPVLKVNAFADYTSIVEALEWADDWITEVFPSATVTDRRRLFQLMCELVITYVNESPAPLGLKTVLNQFKLIPGLVDKAYPGYIKSGLISMLLETKYSSWPENDLNVEV